MSRKQFSVLEDSGAIFVEVQNIYGLNISIFLNSIKNWINILCTTIWKIKLYDLMGCFQYMKWFCKSDHVSSPSV